MGKKKSKSTATYAQLPYQESAHQQEYGNAVKNVDFHTPIVNAYGQAENDINDTTFEEQLPTGVGERIKYGRMFNLRQRKGADLAAAAGQEHQARTSGLGNYAAMTAPNFVQTGGENQQTGFFLPALAANFGGSLGSGAGGKLGGKI